jgi:hypothetical protein
MLAWFHDCRCLEGLSLDFLKGAFVSVLLSPSGNFTLVQEAPSGKREECPGEATAVYHGNRAGHIPPPQRPGPSPQVAILV